MKWLAAAIALGGCDRVFDIYGFHYAAPDAALDAAPDAASAPGGLVAYYPMDDVGPAIACMADATGRGHDGYCLNGVPGLLPGMRNNAFQLDGKIQIHVRDAAELDPPVFTIAFWVELADTTASGCAVNRVVGDSGNSWQLCPFDTLTLYLVGSGGLHGPPVPTGAWHHVALTYDGSSVTGWLDGVVQGTKPAQTSFDSQDMVLGTDLDSGVAAAPYAGALDELRIYERELSAAEIMMLVTAP